jgi:hypothetical protein
MAQVRISALTADATFVGTDYIPFVSAATPRTRRVTMANVRTQLLAGGTGFTAADPLNVGNAAFGVGGVGATSAQATINSGSGSPAEARLFFQRNSVLKGVIGVSGSAGGITAGSAADDLVVRSSQAILFSDNDGTNLRGRMSSGILQWGTTVVAGAAAGEVVVETAKYYRAANAAGTGTVPLIRVNTNDLQVGDGAAVIILGAPGTISGAAAGDVLMAQNKWLRGANSGSTGTIKLITAAGDHVQLSDGTTVIYVGAPATITGAAAGDAVLAQAKWLRGDGGLGSTVGLLRANGVHAQLGDGTNDVIWGKALVALGGGAAPTLGTIGGSGPATAAQNSWMKVLDSSGNSFWVPAWK